MIRRMAVLVPIVGIFSLILVTACLGATLRWDPVANVTACRL